MDVTEIIRYTEQTEDVSYLEKGQTKKILNEFDKEQSAHLDMSYAGWEVDVANIQDIPNDEYALARKHGLGGSDSSILLGVNPYKSIQELIEEKARDHLTAEEKAVGEKVAVRKGRDLEPLVIKKHSDFIGGPVYKPVDMYKCTQYPYLKMNFDGVAGEPKNYYPVEIKIVTASGERHYAPHKAVFDEFKGLKQLPENITNQNMSIQSKAAFYGIPPYYYTQLQQEMMASGAPYGYLSVLFDKSWQFYSFFVWRDENVIKDIIINGYKTWQQIIKKNPERAYE